MFQFVSFLFTNLISKGILSIIYKFNYSLLLGRYLSTLQPAGIHRIILLRIIRVVPETCNYLTSMSVSWFLYFVLIQICSFCLLCTIFKRFIYFDFIITIYSIYSVNSVYPTVIPFKHLFLIYFNDFHN